MARRKRFAALNDPDDEDEEAERKRRSHPLTSDRFAHSSRGLQINSSNYRVVEKQILKLHYRWPSRLSTCTMYGDLGAIRIC